MLQNSILCVNRLKNQKMVFWVYYLAINVFLVHAQINEPWFFLQCLAVLSFWHFCCRTFLHP